MARSPPSSPGGLINFSLMARVRILRSTEMLLWWSGALLLGLVRRNARGISHLSDLSLALLDRMRRAARRSAAAAPQRFLRPSASPGIPRRSRPEHWDRRTRSPRRGACSGLALPESASSVIVLEGDDFHAFARDRAPFRALRFPWQNGQLGSRRPPGHVPATSAEDPGRRPARGRDAPGDVSLRRGLPSRSFVPNRGVGMLAQAGWAHPHARHVLSVLLHRERSEAVRRARAV